MAGAGGRERLGIFVAGLTDKGGIRASFSLSHNKHYLVAALDKLLYIAGPQFGERWVLSPTDAQAASQIIVITISVLLILKLMSK